MNKMPTQMQPTEQRTTRAITRLSIVDVLNAPNELSLRATSCVITGIVCRDSNETSNSC